MDHNVECVDILEAVDDQLDIAIDTYKEINVSRLDDSGRIQHDAVEADLAVQRDELPVLFDIPDGMDSFFDAGLEWLDAFEEIDSYNEFAAKRAFSWAEGHFADTELTFAQLDKHPDLPEDLEPDVIELHCFASAVRGAIGHTYNTIGAYQNGNESRSF